MLKPNDQIWLCWDGRGAIDICHSEEEAKEYISEFGEPESGWCGFAEYKLVEMYEIKNEEQG